MAGFLDGVFNRNKPQQQQPQQTIGQQPMQNQSANPQNFPQNNPQQQQQPNNQQQAPVDPLAQFTPFFKPQASQQTQQQEDPNAQSRNNPQNQPRTAANPQGYLPAFNREGVRAGLAKANFSQNLDPELVQKALSGDQGAFMEVLNSYGRGLMETNMHMLHSTVEQGLGGVYSKVTGEFDSRLRDSQLRSQNPEHEVLKHEAVKPMVQALTMQFAQQDASLSPEQARQKAEEYFLATNSAINQHATQQSQQQDKTANRNKTNANPDFSDFLVDPAQQAQDQNFQSLS